MSVVLMTRQGCHLCDEALVLIRELGAEPELVDVDSDDRLHDQFDWRVPVLLVDGRPVAEGHMTRDQLQRALGLGGSQLR